jgi:putative ABC transport system permease protein
MGIRYALRSLAKNPGFAGLVVFVLALGIGANTAIFSVVNSVLLRPLDFHDPDRIVTLTSAWKNRGRFGQVSAPDFHDWHDQSTAFSAMAKYVADESSVVAGTSPEYAGYALVSREFFAVMDVKPKLGRLLTGDDYRKAAPPVVLVSDAFWRRHFAGQTPDGHQTVRAASQVFPIVGVLPEGFRFPGESEIWLPDTIAEDTTSRSGHNYRVIARMKAAVSIEQAQTQMTAIGSRLEQAYPDTNKNKNCAVTRLQDYTVRDIRLTLYVLLGAVGLVLLIACANVANLMLARATARTREVAIRAAIGASRTQVVSQLFIESFLLAVVSGVAGVLIANWGLMALVSLAPKGLPRLDEVAIDGPVLVFAIGISILASVVFGLTPALKVSQIDPVEAMRQGGARGVVGGSSARLRQVFVIAEVSLCVVLVISAGLLLRSVSSLTKVDLGFNPERILTAELSTGVNGDAEVRRVTEGYFQEIRRRVSAVPGVQSAALAGRLPLDSTHSSGSYIVEGQTMKDFTNTSPQAGFSLGSQGYAGTLGMRVIRGRDFSEQDTLSSPPVALISESLAKQAYPRQDPIGRKILCGLDEESGKWMTIVGVVSEARLDSAAVPAQPEIYMPVLQHPRSDFVLLVKTSGDPMAASETVRRISREMNPDVPLRFNTLESKLADTVASPRFLSLLLSLFAGLALCLALVGVYAVMAYAVAQRSAEVGLRMALGAERSDVLAMVLGQALKLTAVGLGLGLVAALGAGTLLRSLLFGVTATDPATYTGAILLLAAAGLLAGYLPAWRASRIEPLEALRRE